MFRKSNQLSWEKKTFPLAKGFRKITFAFTKDFSVSRGEDKAKIQYLKITGLQDIVLNCDNCPKGTYKSATDSTCLNCPRNTYSDQPGAT
jgi:hypothetical protein